LSDNLYLSNESDNKTVGKYTVHWNLHYVKDDTNITLWNVLRMWDVEMMIFMILLEAFFNVMCVA